jgi:hypothetical protein
MAHVDEETGSVVDYGFVPDRQLVHEFTPEGFYYTRDDMEAVVTNLSTVASRDL